MKIKSRSIFFFPVNVQLLKTLSFLCSTFVTLLKKKMQSIFLYLWVILFSVSLTSVPVHPSVEDLWRLVRAQVLVDSRVSSCPHSSPSPIPGENHHSVPVVLESPGSVLCMGGFSGNTGQVRGLEIVRGVGFHELLTFFRPGGFLLV